MSARTRLLVDGLVFPEGPRWRAGKLWFSDMMSGRVMTVDLGGHVETVVQSDNWVSGLGWLPDGRLLVVSMQDRRLLRLEPQGLTVAADLAALTTFMTNDMVVDGAGRAYVGNVGYDVHGGAPFVPATLVLVTPGGAARVVDADLAGPNGTVITPDGRTLIVAESMANRLTAFDVAPDGSLGGKRIWAEIEGLSPDGICLDADGAVWVASPMLGEVLRVREGGRVLERFATEPMPLACMLGGPDRRTLFVCQAPLPMEFLGLQSGGVVDVAALDALPGRIEIGEVEVPGVGWP
jgi:sugar lactone lactonase YvrE